MNDFAIVFSVAIVLGLAFWARRELHLRKLRSQNFDWYRGEFPSLVANGRVTCYRCKGTSVGTERLMHNTFLRAHICRNCGTTLYYSRED